MNHIKPTTNKLQSHLAFQEYQSCLFGLHNKEFLYRFFQGKQYFQQKSFMRILSKIQPADYLMFFISAQLTSFTHPKHAISDYLYWRDNLHNYETQFDL